LFSHLNFNSYSGIKTRIAEKTQKQQLHKRKQTKQIFAQAKEMTKTKGKSKIIIFAQAKQQTQERNVQTGSEIFAYLLFF